MTTEVRAGYDVGTGMRVLVGNGVDVFIAETATVASQDNYAIRAGMSDHLVNIQGHVYGDMAALYLGDNGNSIGQQLLIGEHAYLGNADYFSVLVYGQGSMIDNRGTIWGGSQGLGLTSNGSASSHMTNSGTIEAGLVAIHHEGTETFVLVNSGLIVADQQAFYSGGLTTTEQITNTGKMVGEIALGGGGDRYDGTNGHLTGKLLGGAGNDVLIGGTDGDWIEGGSGADMLDGNLGWDRYYGGADADRFDFNAIADSGKGGNRDQILDFNHAEHDRIDLIGIDAKAHKSGNQKFAFIGKHDFHDVRGELRYEDKGSKVIVQGDINGDGHADFEIYVKAGSLHASDFLL